MLIENRVNVCNEQCQGYFLEGLHSFRFFYAQMKLIKTLILITHTPYVLRKKENNLNKLLLATSDTIDMQHNKYQRRVY